MKTFIIIVNFGTEIIALVFGDAHASGASVATTTDDDVTEIGKGLGKNFDVTELRTSILEQFFILNYNTVMLLEILRGQHPEKSESIRGEQELYVRYFNEILAGTNLPRETAERIAKLYMETKNPALVAIANRIKP